MARMSPKENIRRGHRNQENGATFEKILGQLFTRMADAELARIAKVPEPLRVLGPGEKGVWRAIYIRGAAMVDYQGTLMGGRAVYLEAKYTRAAKIRARPGGRTAGRSHEFICHAGCQLWRACHLPAGLHGAGALGGMAKDERAFWPQVPEARRPGRDGLGNKPF